MNTTFYKKCTMLLMSLCLIVQVISAQSTSSNQAQEKMLSKASDNQFQNLRLLKPIAQLVHNTKMENQDVPIQHIFRESSTEMTTEVAKVVAKGTLATLDFQALNKLMVTNAPFISVAIPFNGQELTLDLVQAPNLTEDFTVKTSLSNDKAVAYEKGRYYRGIIRGDDASLVAISFFKNELFAVISTAQHNNIVVGKIENKPTVDQYVIYSDKNLQVTPTFDCGQAEAPHESTPPRETTANTAVGGCVRVYFELDYGTFVNRGNSVANSVNYITACFNNVATLYANESISTAISQIFVWETQDPYPTTSLEALSSIRINRSTFNGDLAHLVSLRASTGFSGIAYLNYNAPYTVLCTTAKFAYSQTSAAFENVPTYSWTIEVLTHEMGHNMGSPHTQSCLWPTGPIDGCVAVENGTCTRPALPPAGSGTIMSYCHQVASVGINFANGFGPLPGERIRTAIGLVNCLSASCAPVCTPTAPPVHAVSAITATTTSVSWGAVTGAVSYRVEYRQDAATTWTSINTTALSANMSGLSGATLYYVRVYSFCSASTPSLASTIINFTTLSAPCTAPAAPTVWNVTGTSATVDWTAVAGAVSYRVEYKQDAATTWTTINTTAVSVNLQGLGAVALHNVRIYSLCAASAISAASPTVNFTTLAPACMAPATPSVSNITNTGATITWTAVTGASSYKVEYKTAAATTWLSMPNTITAVPTTLTGLLQGTAYNVRVTTNCTSGASTPSVVANFTTSGRAFPTGLPTCLEDDFRELEKLYDATNGDNWTDKTNWLTANMGAWKGIRLTANGCDVVEINLTNNNLMGTLPNLNLQNLQYLTLYSNQLSGTIPNFNLPNLINLLLYGNQLSGTIPSFNLPSLQTLYLSQNQLTGTIPDFSLPNLAWILLSSNKLTGTIPNFNLPLLRRLSLFQNQLTGTIPNFNLPSLNELALSQNQLTGTIPNFNLPNLVYLYLSQNQLTGTIPNFNFPNLKDLWLHQNQLSGCLPSGLRSLCSHVTSGNISSNPSLATQDWAAFCANGTGECVTCAAPATPSVSSITKTDAVITWTAVTGASSYKVEYKTAAATTWMPMANTTAVTTTLTGLLQGTVYNVRVTTNCTSGASTPSVSATFTTLGRAFPVGLPTCLEDDFRELEKLYDAAGGANWTDKTGWFSTNMATWKGISLTADGCDVKLILLPTNNLVGTLPTFTLPNLQQLILYENKLTGTIPNFNLPNLTDLYLSQNQLSGSIPNFNLPALKSLSLFANQLTGSVPNFNFLNLADLHVGENQLSGTIPNFNFPNLTSLVLSRNMLTGTIPNFNFPNLQNLFLSQNQLTGSIPNFNLPKLQIVSLNQNQLTGSIPNFNLPALKTFYFNNNQLSGCLPSGLRSLCAQITTGNISGNPNLATQDWAAFCANGTGQCTTPINTAYLFAPTLVKCSDVTINIPIVLGQAIQNINEGYTISITYDVNQLTLVDGTKGSIVPADASLLKTLSAGNDIFGIAISSNNISGTIGDVLLNLQFTLKPAATVANTAITLSARIVEAKSGVEQVFDANRIYTVSGASGAKIVVYNNGVMLSDALPTTLQWTGTNPTQTATLSGGQATLNNTGNTTLSINRPVNIPAASPVIGGQDAFKAWNIVSNYALYHPTIDEIIAADANGSGTITIADVSAILKRGVGSLPTGFPQTVGANKDWRFYPRTLLTTPAFTISAKYPFCDGSGYCSTNVPVIAATYPLQITSTTCEVVTKEWNSVLIGNVTGSTGSFFRNPSVVASLRGAPPTVKFMLTDSVRTPAGLFIPLFITDIVPTTGLDMAFSSPSIIIEGMTDTVMNYVINSGSSVGISAFAVNNDGVVSGTKIGYLKIQTIANRKLNATDFGTVVANVNGEMPYARVEFTSAILAVSLTKFEAHPLSKNVELTWSTSSEQQNDHFEVQRSTDGKTFSKIGNIKGQGTTTVQHGYQLLDESPFSGINYYRLKQVDMHEQSEFSKTVSVTMLNSDKNITVYPNPVKDKVMIETNITGDYSIELFDITGKLLQQHQAHQPVLQLSTSDLSRGVYMISVTSNAVQKTFKIVKQ